MHAFCEQILFLQIIFVRYYNNFNTMLENLQLKSIQSKAKQKERQCQINQSVFVQQSLDWATV